LIAVTLASLVGCGGGGASSGESSSNSTEGSFSGNSSAATASEENSEALAMTAFEGVSQALITGEADLPVRAVIEEESVYIMFNDLLSKEGLGLPTGAITTVTTPSECGGAQGFTATDSVLAIGSRLTVKIAYDNYCQACGSITDGIVEYSATYMGDYLFHDMSLIYDVRFSTIVGGEIGYSINVAAQCSGEFDDFNSTDCNISSDFTGITGGTCRVENVSLEGAKVSATVYESELGKINVVGRNLHQCSNGNFDAGEISVTDSTGEEVIMLTFYSCDEYVMIYEDVANTYSQLNN
jgi:hypothetical protein